MADATDGGKRAGGDGARHDFLVELAQVLDAAAAAANDEHIALGALAGFFDGGSNQCGRALALYRGRVKHDGNARHATAQRDQHIAQRGGVG